MSEHDIRAVSEHYASILRNNTVQCCAASHIGFNKIIGISLRLFHSKINSPSWLKKYVSFSFVRRIYSYLLSILDYDFIIYLFEVDLAFYSSRMAERGERSSWCVNKTDLVTSLAEYLNLKHTHLVSSLHLGKIEATRPAASRSRGTSEHREYPPKSENVDGFSLNFKPSIPSIQMSWIFSIFIQHFHGFHGGLGRWLGYLGSPYERGLLLTSGNMWYPQLISLSFPKAFTRTSPFFLGG